MPPFSSGQNAHPHRLRSSALLAAFAVALLFMGSAPPASESSEASTASASTKVPAAQACFQIDDFENHRAGNPPGGWKTNKGRTLVPADRSTMTRGHQYVVTEEEGNKFVRATMRNYAYRLIKLSGDHFPEWNTQECPMLSWRWRVNDYPEGADETDDDNNDMAAAVYVTFSRNWIGRPKSIKYTYSSTQPVGTTVDYGSLKVLVVASARDGGAPDEWKSFSRDVVRDYKNLFGKAPDDDTPIGIQLFSDADAGDGTRTAEADFDDVRVMRK